MTLSITVIKCLYAECHYAECSYVECRVFIAMLSVILRAAKDVSTLSIMTLFATLIITDTQLNGY